MPKKLLLADDSVTIQKVVGISFANEDVEILTVDNGDDALARAREARPDIVLADVVMPGRTGYEVCEELKADPELSHIPVLLLTGTFEAFDEERAARAGADGHITKPFEAQSLVDEVNRLLAQAPRAGSARTHAPAAPSPEPGGTAPTAPQPPQALGMDSARGAPVARREEFAPDGDADGAGAFDFFDDEGAAVREAPYRPSGQEGGARPPEPPAVSGAELASQASDVHVELAGDEGEAEDATAFELEAGESAFDLAPVVDEPGPPGGAMPSPRGPAPGDLTGDRTVAFDTEIPDLSEDDSPWPEEEDLDAAFGEEELGALGLEDRGAGPSEDEAFDFRREALAPPAAAPRSEASCPGDATALAGVAEEAEGRELLEEMEPGEAARHSLLDPDAEDAFAVSSSDLGEALGLPPEGPPSRPEAAPSPVPEPVSMAEPAGPSWPEPAEPLVSLAPEAAETEIATPAADARPDLSPEMRERVHDSLEKIAWEAFADLPDTVVRHAVAKIEEIAWEVVPQMAEAVIREEIRRLKGEQE